ncbi:MAG: hypothetical protein D3922_01830 [Candidatus Electrothrix sp. AR1]|nr:hypothetical protein [Candidatus Electrothrix sp. AR1]
MAKQIGQKVLLLACILFATSGWSGLVQYTEKLHRVKIGFNIGYPNLIAEAQPALIKVIWLGITEIRVYEIFNGKEGEASYQKRLKAGLDILIAYGVRPMICISNFPLELIPTNDKQNELKQFLPKRNAKRIGKILSYSNRFPPENLQEYGIKIHNLIDFLFQHYGRTQVQQWYFEIGNEPDAPLYFWGRPEQFEKLAKIALEIFKRNGIAFAGGFGTTHNSVFSAEYKGKRSSIYHEVIRNFFYKKKFKGIFFSFHLYDRERQVDLSDPLKGMPNWLSFLEQKKIITEWNVASQPRKANKIFSAPGVWGRGFIQLLIACHRDKIDTVYLFKLMDNKRFKSLQLGAFDVAGNPKRWFREFEEIWRVVRDGYTIEPLLHSTYLIHGTGKYSIILAGKSMEIIDSNLYQIDKSFVNSPTGTVAVGKWAILKRLR